MTLGYKQLKNQIVHVFGMVMVKQSPPTAKGMVFVTLEDETGFINLVFHPHKYACFFEMIEHHPFLCACGELQVAGDYRSILVHFLYPTRTHTAPVIKMNKKGEKRKSELPEPRHYY